MANSESRRPRYTSIKSQGSENGWARPPSPTFSTTTTGSRVNLPPNHMLITRKDLRQSIACFEELMAAAKAYRNALLAMSQATAAFAQAMEACSRVKGCRSSNSALAGASGLQHLLANNDQLLADTVYRQFEIPLLSALDHYKLITADRLARYEQSLSEQSARIRKTEAENLRGGRRRKRDLDSFRVALQELQRQVDELDNVKAGYHEEVLEGEDEIWDTVLAKVAFVVRSQLDFCEKIAGKASDSILEPLVSSIPDPFDTYGPPKEEGQIFSVLSPLGLLDTIPQSPTPGFTRSRQPTSGTTGISPPHSLSKSSSGSTSPTKSIFPSLTPLPIRVSAPAVPETSTVSALGIKSPDDEDQGGRARRELSVIDEREGGLDREAERAEVVDERREVEDEIVSDETDCPTPHSRLLDSAGLASKPDETVSEMSANARQAATPDLLSKVDHLGPGVIPILPCETESAPSGHEIREVAQSADEEATKVDALDRARRADTREDVLTGSAAA